MPCLKIFLEQLLNWFLKENPTFSISLSNHIKRTRHNITNTELQNLKQTQTRSKTNKDNQLKPKLVDRVILTSIYKLKNNLHLLKSEIVHPGGLSTADMNQIWVNSNTICINTPLKEIFNRLNLFLDGLMRQLGTLSEVS